MDNNDQIVPFDPRGSRSVQGYALQQGGYVPRRVLGVQHLAQWKNNPR